MRRGEVLREQRQHAGGEQLHLEAREPVAQRLDLRRVSLPVDGGRVDDRVILGEVRDLRARPSSRESHRSSIGSSTGRRPGTRSVSWSFSMSSPRWPSSSGASSLSEWIAANVTPHSACNASHSAMRARETTSTASVPSGSSRAGGEVLRVDVFARPALRARTAAAARDALRSPRAAWRRGAARPRRARAARCAACRRSRRAPWRRRCPAVSSSWPRRSVPTQVSDAPGSRGSRTRSQSDMLSFRSEGPVDHRDLGLVASQKTVQGESGSANSDPGAQAEILALLLHPSLEHLLRGAARDAALHRFATWGNRARSAAMRTVSGPCPNTSGWTSSTPRSTTRPAAPASRSTR